jgi:hypothetical protein
MCVAKLTKTSTTETDESLSVTRARVKTHFRNRVLGVVPRGTGLSVDRDCAGRNALSGVKVSSPDNILRGGRPFMELGIQHLRLENAGTTGVQVHGMYKWSSSERKRSASGRGTEVDSSPRVHIQGVKAKFKTIPNAEVRCPHSSDEAGQCPWSEGGHGK